jgi:hypothetical protein
MRSLLCQEIKRFIRAIPVKSHSVQIDQKNWKKKMTSKEIAKLFKGKEKIRISRRELLKPPHFTELKIKKIILWGYPSGSRVTPKMVRHKTIQKIRAHLKRSPKTWGDLLKAEINGVADRTLTKLAYFCNIRTKDKNCPKPLILDSQILASVKNFKEFKEFDYESVTANSYKKYLAIMHKTAQKIGCKPDQLEFFLFRFGSSFC